MFRGEIFKWFVHKLDLNNGHIKCIPTTDNPMTLIFFYLANQLGPLKHFFMGGGAILKGNVLKDNTFVVHSCMISTQNN